MAGASDNKPPGLLSAFREPRQLHLIHITHHYSHSMSIETSYRKPSTSSSKHANNRDIRRTSRFQPNEPELRRIQSILANVADTKNQAERVVPAPREEITTLDHRLPPDMEVSPRDMVLGAPYAGGGVGVGDGRRI